MPDDIENPLINLMMYALRTPEVAAAAKVDPQSWALHHVFDHLPDNIGPANNGRLPYVVLADLGETYEHQTAAPRGGTRSSTFELTVHVRGFGSHTHRARARRLINQVCNAISSVVRAQSQTDIGDETRLSMIRRPYGFSGGLALTVETSFGPGYYGDCR